MKKRKPIIAFVLISISFLLSAQVQKPKSKWLQLYDISIQTGVFAVVNTKASLADFKTLAPNSALLQNIPANYRDFDYCITPVNTMFSAILGFNVVAKHKNIEKANPKLRLGITYFSGVLLKGCHGHTEQSPYDTLVSKKNGSVYYLDTLSGEINNVYYSTDELRLDGSLIFRTKSSARWSVYGGLGITVGFSLNAMTNIIYLITESATLRNNKNNNSNFYYFFYASSSEKQHNKNGFKTSAYLPMGLD